MKDKRKQYDRQNAFNKERYTSIHFPMAQEMKDQVKALAAADGISASEFIRQAISREIERRLSAS